MGGARAPPAPPLATLLSATTTKFGQKIKPKFINKKSCRLYFGIITLILEYNMIFLPIIFHIKLKKQSIFQTK